jgi:hypothetical protein
MIVTSLETLIEVNKTLCEIETLRYNGLLSDAEAQDAVSKTLARVKADPSTLVIKTR